MNRNCYIILIALLIWLPACMKDKGNYDLQAVNRVAIAGIDPVYMADYGKRIVIKPELSFTLDQDGDAANYSYLWVASHIVGMNGIPKILSNERVLDTVISGIDFGSYFSYFRVTDKRTGIFTDHYFVLNVGSPDYEGWLMLCDTEDGKSRLDIVSRRGSNDILYKDVIGLVGSGFSTNDRPAFITSNMAVMGPAVGELGVYIATKSKAAVLGRNNLEYQPANDLGNFYAGSLPFYDFSNARLTLQWMGGVLYTQNRLYNIKERKISGPVNTQDGNPALFRPSPFVGVDPLKSSEPAIVFNEDNQTFLRLPARNTTCITLPTGTLFDFTINMNLVWMEFSPYNGGEVFAILKDPSNKVFLARFTTSGIQHYFGEITVPGIADAVHFAVSPELGYLFYNVGSAIYEYDMMLRKNLKMLDYGTRPITVMKFQPFAYSPIVKLPNRPFYEELSRKLLVATYDGTDALGSGQLDLFTVPGINGQLQKYQSYNGMGKIVSLTYRER